MSHQNALQSLIPLNTLAPENFRELAVATAIEKVAVKTEIFKEGDTDNQAIYLLEGEVVLESGKNGMTRLIASGSEDAKYALAQLKPRQVSGIAASDCIIARVDGDLLDRLLTWDQVSGIEVVEMDGDEDANWMLQVLRSPAFARLPPMNANDMFSRMERVLVSANEIVVRQGDPGDYYYLIREGKCTVSQKGADGKVAVVNQLTAGDQFGEEALVSDVPRNATIMMMTDGELMRLAKDDFIDLLKKPLTAWVSQSEAETLIADGAELLDVRTEAEFARGAIRSARNAPLFRIRQVLGDLDPDRKYVVCCQTGSRSEIAAFMLNQRGFDAFALQGGLQALRGAAAENPGA
jgi:CRP-like cAMP-binding protein